MKFRTTAICIFLIIIITFLNITTVCSQSNYELKKHFKFYMFYGTTFGLGGGCDYQLNKKFSIHLLAGTEPFFSLIWAAPFSGNMLNFNIKAEMNLYSGFYFSTGWYTGLFNLKYDDLDVSEYIWESGPTLAIGIKIPNNANKRRLGLEIGSVFNLPTKLTTTRETLLDSV